MFSLLILALIPAQLPILESKDFPRELQHTALEATVRIDNATKKMTGTGVIVGSKGAWLYILTAAHVVKDAEMIEISLFTKDSYPQPKELLRPATVITEGGGVKDLALLRVLAGELKPTPIKIAPTIDVKKKDFTALTVGCSLSREPTCEIAQVSSAKQVIRAGKSETGWCWEINKTQQTGRSGGPMLDRNGRLIGICSGNNLGVSYFCHLREIDTLLRPYRESLDK